MDDLRTRTVRGGLAKALAQGASFVARLGSLMVLSRLLEPRDFGLVTMVTAVTGIFGMFKDAGLSVATVQRVNVTNEQISTLFWVNILIGLVLALLSTAMAPFLARFYHEPRLVSVGVALSMGYLFNAAGVQHSAILQRQMRFSAMAAIDLISLFVSIAVGVGMAVAGLGYWALVGMAVTAPAAASAGAWLAAAWVPGRPSRNVGVGSMLRFGGTTTLNSLVAYIAYNMEKALLGRYWGADALGIYGRAYQLVNISTDNLNSTIGAVTFSALSRLQDDPQRFKSFFLKGYTLIVALALPATLAFALFGDAIVAVVLGPKWRDATPVFRLLTPTVLMLALVNPLGWLLLALGLVGRALRIALVILPVTVAAYIVGLPYGPRGVAAACSAALILWLVPHVAWSIHGTVISAKDLLRSVGRPFLSAVVAGAAAAGLRWGGLQALPPFPMAALGCAFLLVVYLAMLLYATGQKDFYLDLLRGLRKRSSVAVDQPQPG